MEKFAHTIPPSKLIRCSECNHYIGEHSDIGCKFCDCKTPFHDMIQDLRSGDLRGYVCEVSRSPKIAILIGNSYHIFNLEQATQLARFILEVVDVGEMSTMPDKDKNANQKP